VKHQKSRLKNGLRRPRIAPHKRWLHVKRGDTVLVIAGNDKGKQGEVKETFPAEGRVLVSGVNLRWNHNKPTQQNPKGERVQAEVSIHASNVRLSEAGAAKKSKRAAAAKAKAGKATAAGKKK
jgi:large subunit ribosomal protein L24